MTNTDVLKKHWQVEDASVISSEKTSADHTTQRQRRGKMLTTRLKPCTSRGLRAMQWHLLRGRGFASNWATQLGAEQDIISVDRRALAGESSRMVLLHDYRDLKFLQRISAAGLFGTLMSSSGLAYAMVLTWPVEHCLMFAFQMVGVPLALHAYLRTYVARAVLDPKRSQLLVTGCTWFGTPRSSEDAIFLDQLRPGHALEGGYIKFRLEGSAWDISRWIWFRMPRGGHGVEAVRPGKQVGNRPVARPAATLEQKPGEDSSSGDARRHFLGAGLGGNTSKDGPEFAAPRAPQMRQTQEPMVSQGPRRVMQAPKLQNGLPASSQEEQKLFDFFSEPSEFGLCLRVATSEQVNLEIHEWQAEKTKLSKRRPSDLEDAPVVAAPSEEEVALAWRPKESASGSSCSESFVSRGDPEIQGRWTVPPRLPSVDRATPPRTPPRSVMVTEEVEARDFRSNELRPHVVRSASGPRAASVGHRYSPSPRPKPEDLPCYGLDAELKAKAAAKYSHSAEEAAANWVQAVTGHHFQIDFGTTLRSGAILCDLVNCIRPGSISKVNAPGMPFKERENICNFLRACRSFGVQEYALFSTDDLYEEKNLMSVVNCLHALGGAVQRSVPQFPGPHLGVIDTSNTKRDFKRDLGPVSQTGGLHF
eukprot:symbB.v1.2.006726.t4/scaffold402.1/size211320/20